VDEVVGLLSGTGPDFGPAAAAFAALCRILKIDGDLKGEETLRRLLRAPRQHKRAVRARE